VRVSVTDLERSTQRIEGWIKGRERAYVCVAPVATVIEAQDDPIYKTLVNNADMVTPDGMPIVWSVKMKGEKSVQRTYGPDLFLKICEEGQDLGYKHFFYGGTEETLDCLKKSLEKRFPKIEIVGQYAPPMGDKNRIEDDQVINRINQSNPDVLWVGLGAPKQEYWMANHRNKLDVPVMIGVGAAFDFIAGVKKQAPAWMRKIGLEWLFRLCAEPKRLWRRYIIGNSRFLWLMLLSHFQKNTEVST